MAATYTSTGPLLTTIRTGLGLTRADLAARLGVSVETVRSWEAGRRSVPDDTWSAMSDMESAQEEEIARHIEAFTSRGIPFALLYLDPSEEEGELGWQRAVAARVRRVVPGVAVVEGPAGN